MADLADVVGKLSRDLADIQRRLHWQAREGVVTEIDEVSGLYRVDLGGGFLSPWIGVEALSSGALRIQAEPVVGQTVKVSSQSGDMTDAIISLSSFSDSNARPHDKAGELKISVGGTVITGAADMLKLESNGAAITLGSGGVAITGPALTHNGTSVGDDHTHSGVTPGGGDTGVPN